MKQYIYKSIAGGLLLCLFSCSTPEPELTIVNDSEIDRIDEPVVISREDFVQKTGKIPGGKYPVLVGDKGNLLPSQLDDTDRNGQWDELAFSIDIPADTTLTLPVRYVNTENFPGFPARTNIRFGVMQNGEVQPVEELVLSADELPGEPFSRFQMDGPAWENDKVGFRQYIDGRNSRDVYGKTTPEMALEMVGISEQGELVDNYHVLAPWGRDILSVGASLGLGGLGVVHQGAPVRLGIKIDAPRNNVETSRYQLISEGPVRSVFTLTYEDWIVGDTTYDLENRVTIWAGKYWHSNQIILHANGQADTLVVGLVNNNNNKPLMVLDEAAAGWTGLATHDMQTYEKEYYLGMALILPADTYTGYREAPETGPGIVTSYNALLNLESGSPATYYVLADWGLSDPDFKDRSFFRNFVQQEITKIANPVRVE